ncbi:MAG TPA: hypothetical protein VK860_08705 [Ilumatobacteraceae bacterium]|nr:hypothetical protein [Ilumatobacteraceae bacterium]
MDGDEADGVSVRLAWHSVAIADRGQISGHGVRWPRAPFGGILSLAMLSRLRVVHATPIAIVQREIRAIRPRSSNANRVTSQIAETNSRATLAPAP